MMTMHTGYHWLGTACLLALAVVVLGACGADPDGGDQDAGWDDTADGWAPYDDDEGYDGEGGEAGDDLTGDQPPSGDGAGDGGPLDGDDGGVSDDAGTSTDAYDDDLLRRQGDATPPDARDGANR